MPERAPAKKVRLIDLTTGQWVKKEGEAGFVLTSYGEMVFRAWLIATVIKKFSSEDSNFISIILDDGTDTIRAKIWHNEKTSKKIFDALSALQAGDLIDIIGKVREYDGEIYITPEIISKVEDPNLQTLRRLEILRKIKTFKPEIDQKEALKQSILNAIGDGISYTELLAKLGKTEIEIELIINELLAEGLCYEPSPGKIKKIS
jgi:RPA family protein